MSSWLFDTRDVVARPDDGQAALTVASGGNDGVLVLLGESVRHLEGCIGALKRDAVVHFVTYGKWSMHQLIIYLLKQIGPSRLYMTSWSLTEQPLRALLNARMQGLILEAHCILSDRVIERTPKVYDLAKGVFSQLKLIKLHAKVCVLENDGWCIAIVGSANFTNNPRVEAGVIDTHGHVGAFHKKWILDELAKHNG